MLGRPLRRLTEHRSPLRCAAAVNERLLGDGGLFEVDVVGRESILLELGRSQVAQCGPLDVLQCVKHKSSYKFQGQCKSCAPQKARLKVFRMCEQLP